MTRAYTGIRWQIEASSGTAPIVLSSSWIRGLERMNRVHDGHSQERFSRLLHFILTFHDTTFECISAADPDVVIPAGTTPHQAATEASPRSE